QYYRPKFHERMAVSVFSEATVSISLALGEVPAARTGPTLTVMGQFVYMFGGRLMDSPTASNDLFVFDLTTLIWERLKTVGPSPTPRFLHSATAWDDDHLIICAGSKASGPDIEPLNDICIYNLRSGRWTIYEFTFEQFTPRYAHLACLVDHQLHILGGQSGERRYVMDGVVFDLKTYKLSEPAELSHQFGSHYCASSGDDILYCSKGRSAERQWLSVSSGFQGQTFRGGCLPPSFRFPDIHRLGSSLVVSGCFTSNNLQAYGIWALDTDTLQWRPIDTGSCLVRGSWNRGVLHASTQRYIVFGHNERDLRADYQFRRVNFNHISAISLEAFAIYSTPVTCTEGDLIGLGLVLMYEPRFSNFALLTEDGYRIQVNLGILRRRWPAIDDFIRGQEEVGKLRLQESYPIAMGFVRFLYTNSLDFEEAQPIDVLGRLLVFAKRYACAPLSNLAAFHLHSRLSIANAPLIYRYAALAGRDGLKLRCLALMIAQRHQLAQDRQFWKQYPKALRHEIISFMPPNFKSPFGGSDPELSCERADIVSLAKGSSTLDPVSPPPEPGFGSLKSRRSRATATFLRFNAKRPSLASFFSFASAYPSPPSADREVDPKLTRMLAPYKVGSH
ncbi:hypothetical protein L0F63_007013, partial [Massospora cicadina]